MKFFRSRQIADYRLLTATRDINLYSDISELQDLVEGALDEGVNHIAVQFTPHSYLLSRSMAVLVKCIEAVAETGGTFAIVAPNEQIMDFLAVVDQEHKIRFFAHETELLAGTRSPSP